jgi:hypothetical protein
MKKITLISLSVLLLLIIYVFNFSVTYYRYECNGIIQKKEAKEDLTVFLKLGVLAFHTKLWSDSDGSLWIESPNQWVDSYTDLDKVADSYQIYSYENELKGNFSTLSKTIMLDTDFGFYDGKCKEIE